MKEGQLAVGWYVDHPGPRLDTGAQGPGLGCFGRQFGHQFGSAHSNRAVKPQLGTDAVPNGVAHCRSTAEQVDGPRHVEESLVEGDPLDQWGI